MLIAVLFFVFRSFLPVDGSQDCSPASGALTCDCTATSIECSGIGTNTSEVQDVLKLAGTLSMDTVILKITDLKFESNFTIENTNIRNLTLGYGFQILSSNFFSGVPSLVSLNLQNNSIRDIDDQLFSSLPALKELLLDENDLNNLTANMFVNLTNLNYLSIMRNNITEINSDVFQNLHDLKTLILSHNNITSIGNLRITSTSVTELKISNCLIEGALENDTFSNMSNLQLLDMSHNKFSEIKSHSLSILKDLQLLDLSYNSIQHLHDHAFSGMKNLTYLDLRGNQISVIKITSFAGLQKLKYLDLSANSLSAVLCEYTTDLDSLEKIYLQDNKIKSFTQGAFFYSLNLEILNVSGNNLECSCSLTDTALHLINNTTMKKEDLELVSCIIPSTFSSVSITDYESSKCVPMDPCKKPDYEDIESPDDDDFDYLDNESTPTSTDNDTTTVITSIIHLTTTESVSTVQIMHTAIPNTASDATETIKSDIESTTLSIENATTPSTTSTSRVTTEPITEMATESTVNDTLSSIVLTSPATTVTVTESPLLPTNATTTEITSTALSTDISSTENTTPSTVKTTVARITTSSMPAGSSCFLLDLFVPNVTSDSEFEVFKNFSYDGSTLCVKWAIAGNLKNVSRCVIKYTKEKGIVSKPLKCPSVAKDINIWSIAEKVSRFCLDIYAPVKTRFCNDTVYKTTPTIPTEVTTPVITFSQKSVETVGLSETYLITVSTDIGDPTSTSEEETTIFKDHSDTEISLSPFSIITLKVHFNDSNLAFASWTVNKEEPPHACNMTLKAHTQYLDYKEGVFPCKNDSHQLRNVKETDIFRICIVSHHKVSGETAKCALSVASALESKSNKDEDNQLNSTLIPLICLLILLGILIMFIVFKNIFRKKQESFKYDVRAEEVKYEQRVKLRPESTNDQSMRFSYIARDNFDNA